jgi:hypothetical protein
MRGHYGPFVEFTSAFLPGTGYPRAADDVRPASEMSWGDAGAVALLIAIGGLVVYGAKRAGDYAKDQYDKKLKLEGTLPKARVLNGERR